MSAPPVPTPPAQQGTVGRILGKILGPVRLFVSQAKILHLLGVFVITPFAGLVAAYVAKILPVHFDSTQITAIFSTGAAAGLALCLHYLHGWQWWEKNIAPYFDVTAKLAQMHKDITELQAEMRKAQAARRKPPGA